MICWCLVGGVQSVAVCSLIIKCCSLVETHQRSKIAQVMTHCLHLLGGAKLQRNAPCQLSAVEKYGLIFYRVNLSCLCLPAPGLAAAFKPDRLKIRCCYSAPVNPFAAVVTAGSCLCLSLRAADSHLHGFCGFRQ